MDGFKKFVASSGRRGPIPDKKRLSISRSSVHYSKNLLEALGNPESVDYLFDESKGLLALKAGTEGSWKVSKARVTCSKDLVIEILKHTKSEKDKRFDGDFDAKEKAVVFNLKKPVLT